MGKEIELKLALPPTSVDALRAHPILAGAQVAKPAQRLENTYFDTEGLALRRERIALRLRKAGDTWLQTIKCAAVSQGGLSSRPEWEQPWNGESFDFSEIEVPAVRERLEAQRSELRPAFSTDFQRETWRIVPRRGVAILAMLDQGEVRAAGRSAPICELELELEKGDARDVLALAEALAAELPLLPEDTSKAQRGYALFRDERAGPVRARPSRVRAEDSAIAAFRLIGFDGLAHWQANEAAAQAGDAESVHQARVALRRLRTAIGLFRDNLPADFAALWRARLSDLASALGGARDAEVILRDLVEPVITEAAEASDLERLAERLRAHRDATLEQHAAPGRGAAILALSAALHALPEQGGDTVTTLARDAMRRIRRKARKQILAVEAGELAELHRLRILFKRLRYGLDFFAPLWPQEEVVEYQERLAELQDDLGQVNDATTGNRLLAEIAGDDAGLVAARAFVAGWHAPRIERLRRRALKRARKLLWQTPPWKHADRTPIEDEE